LHTDQKVIELDAGTAAGRTEWILALQKTLLQLKYKGNGVKVVIPLAKIVECAKSSAFTFTTSESIHIKALESNDFVVDEYFFTYFADIDEALLSIKAASERNALPANAPAQTRLRVHS